MNRPRVFNIPFALCGILVVCVLHRIYGVFGLHRLFWFELVLMVRLALMVCLDLRGCLANRIIVFLVPIYCSTCMTCLAFRPRLVFMTGAASTCIWAL